MRYLVVDGMLHGTGIRDKNEGGYVKLETLNLPDVLNARIKEWLLKYEEEHYNGYLNSQNIEALDLLGIEIAKQVQAVVGPKVTYFSNAKLKEQEV
jgi:hypothetical protein